MTINERNKVVMEVEEAISEKLNGIPLLDAYFIRTFLSIDLARGVLCGSGGNVNNPVTIDAVSRWEAETVKMIHENCQTAKDVLDTLSQMADVLRFLMQEVKKHE